VQGEPQVDGPPGGEPRRSQPAVHLLVAEAEAPVGVGSEVMAILNEECFFELDAPPCRVTAANVPIPYNHSLEKAAIPNVHDVVERVLSILPEKQNH